MSFRRLVGAVAALATALPLTASMTGTAAAAADWSLPSTVADERNEIEDFDLDVGADGTAAVAWAYLKNVPRNSGYLYGATTYISVSVRGPNDSSWSAPQAISVTDEDSHNPDVAVDSDGDVVVVWGSSYVVDSLRDGEDAAYEPQVRAAFKPANSFAFGAAQTIESTGEYSFSSSSFVAEPAVTFDSAGNAVALWPKLDSNTYEYDMRSARIPSGSSRFGSPSRIDRCSDASLPAIAADGAGGVLAMWACSDFDSGRRSLKYAKSTGGGAFGSVDSVTVTADRLMSELVVEMGPAGRAVALLASYYQDAYVEATVMTNGAAFGSLHRVATRSNDFIFDLDVAVGPRGEAVGTWTEGASALAGRAADLASGSTSFGFPYSLGALGTSVDYGSDGTVYAVWGTEGYQVRASERAPGGNWGSQTTISTGSYNLFPKVGVGGKEGGRPVAAWLGGEELDKVLAAKARIPYTPAGKEPIILIPGILGTEIVCERSDVLWPDALFKDGDLLQTRLASDGRSPFDPRDNCNKTARPRKVIRSIAGGLQDVYAGAENFLNTLPGKYLYSFGYDWRKNPKYSLARLDALVNRALAETGDDKVVIVAHSMGGLVTQAYIRDDVHAAKVDRVVTIGTPYWGAVKAWNIVGHGIEEDLNNLYERSTIKRATRNMSGVYSLFPSRNLANALGGSFVWREGQEERSFDHSLSDINAIGGNARLFREAAAWHASVDGFDPNGVRYHIVVGTGQKTVVGVRYDAHWSRLGDEFGNGDGTVPIESQLQAAADQLPSGVGVSFICGISHAAEPNEEVVHDLIYDFVVSSGEIATGNKCTTWSEE